VRPDFLSRQVYPTIRRAAAARATPAPGKPRMIASFAASDEPPERAGWRG